MLCRAPRRRDGPGTAAGRGRNLERRRQRAARHPLLPSSARSAPRDVTPPREPRPRVGRTPYIVPPPRPRLIRFVLPLPVLRALDLARDALRLNPGIRVLAPIQITTTPAGQPNPGRRARFQG